MMLLLFALGVIAPADAAPVSPPLALTPAQQQVWQGEVRLWAALDARDGRRVMAFMAPEVRGWPCGADHPVDYAALSRSSSAARADAPRRTTVPTPEAVVLGQDFAMTFLSAETQWTDKEGHRQSQRVKVLHSWKPTPSGWKIVGGMCAPLDP